MTDVLARIRVAVTLVLLAGSLTAGLVGLATDHDGIAWAGYGGLLVLCLVEGMRWAEAKLEL